MVAVGMMEMARDEVVNVVPMRHCLVAAGTPVLVANVVLGTVVAGCAVRWVAIADLNRVTFDGAGGVAVQLAVVQVVDMVTVADSRVPAAGSVLVFVCFAHVSSVR